MNQGHGASATLTGLSSDGLSPQAVSPVPASIPSAARQKAETEAAKREKHKPRSLTDKRWEAVHNSVRGWHVALVADQNVLADVAARQAKQALRSGDMRGFVDAASEMLLARCRAELAHGSASGMQLSEDGLPAEGEALQPGPAGETPNPLINQDQPDE